MELVSAIGFILIGYLSGSLSFAYWMGRIVLGVDVRDAGSGHATTTNIIRQAGWGPGAIVLVLDIAKGFLPTYLAFKYSPVEWAIPLTAAAAVAGHCWPLFIGFRGGMGLATAGGTILSVYPLGFFIGLGVLIFLVLAIKHSARASFVTGLLLAPTYWLFGKRGLVIWLTIAIGLVVSVRFLSDWNRQYRELWLDRETQ